VDVGILGPLQASCGDSEPLPLGGPRQRAVLAALALEAGRTVPTARLIDDVWGCELPAAPARTLTTAISRIRVAVGDPGRIIGETSGYRLALETEAVDALRFERLVKEGCARLAGGDPSAATTTLQEALGLWRGEPLVDTGAAPLRSRVSPRLEELRLQALECRIEADLALGDHGQLAGELVGLLTEHPLRESLVALLMRLFVTTGRRSDALAVFEDARGRLADQLGIGPGERLCQLHVAILREETQTSRGGQGRVGSNASATGPSRPDLPLPVLAPRPAAHVGRPQLLARLREAWSDVSGDGGTRTAMLVGEPGVGKTQTAAEIAEEIHGKGGRVLVGGCDEELPVPYQPFVEMLDWQVTHAPELPLGRLPGELVRLLPDLPHHLGIGLPAPVASDPAVEQHRLFAAVASWLAEVSRPQGLLLVIEDLHWSSPPTLRLLQHVVRTLTTDRRAGVLVITTHRDTDVHPSHPLTATLAQLRRLAPAEELAMRGLSRDETRALIEGLGGHELEDARLLHLVHGSTRGNPFFVTELLTHLVETGRVRLEEGGWVMTPEATVDVPAGVRDVVCRRVARLSPATRELLRHAALMVGDAHLDVLRDLSGRGLEAVLDAVDEATDACLIETSGPDRFRFTHDLVRATLAETSSEARRRRLHGRVADAMEAAASVEVSALAHHAAVAAPVDGGWERAIEHTLAAGEQALSRRAADDAPRWFAESLALISDSPGEHEQERLRARCGLTQARRVRREEA
jgi:DNA-binding SARP family transcriptional activator